MIPKILPLFRMPLPTLFLGMVLCAPLFNYFGHAVEMTLCGLGVVALISYMAGTGQLRAPWRPVWENRSFQIGTLLVLLTFTSWGYSSCAGNFPDTVRYWAQLPPLVALLTVFGVYANRLSPSVHGSILKALAVITTGLAVLMILECFFPPLSMAIRHSLREDRLNFVAPLLVFGFPYTLHQWRLGPRKVWMPVVVLLAIFLSNGRIGWVVAPVVAALYLGLMRKEMGLRRIAGMAGMVCVAALAGVALLAVAYGPDFLMRRVHDLLSGSGEGRLDIWHYALTAWWNANIWFGIGVQGFRYLDFSGTTLTSTAHPHNAAVQLLLETGLVGTALTFVTLGFLLFQGWKNMAAQPAQRAAVLLSFAGVVGCALASTSLFHVWWALFLFIPLMWVLVWPRGQNGQNRKTR